MGGPSGDHLLARALPVDHDRVQDRPQRAGDASLLYVLFDPHVRPVGHQLAGHHSGHPRLPRRGRPSISSPLRRPNPLLDERRLCKAYLYLFTYEVFLYF